MINNKRKMIKKMRMKEEDSMLFMYTFYVDEICNFICNINNDIKEREKKKIYKNLLPSIYF